MAITIQQLINALDPGKVEVQILGNQPRSLTMRGAKRGHNPTHLEVKFNSAPENMHKEAIIVWVDRKDLDDAINKLQV